VALGARALGAFGADVTLALETLRAGAKRGGSDFGARMAERRGAEVADLALGTLRSLLDEARGKAAARADAATKAVRVWPSCCGLLSSCP
jgi:hypothetical protein